MLGLEKGPIMIFNNQNMNNRFSVSVALCFVLFAFMVTGSITTANVNGATTTTTKTPTLPNCIDPTGHNLPCVLFISTLSPPSHTISCQETSGQAFKCTFIIEKLPNGSKIVTITVYIPTNTVVKQIQSIHVVRVNVRVSVHTTIECGKDRHVVIIDGLHECVANNPTPSPDNSCLFNPEQDKCKPDPKTGQCPPGFNMNGYEHCFPNKQCPKGFENHDEDETGTCYPVTTSMTHNNVSYTTNSNPGPSSKSSKNNDTKTTPLSPCDPTIKNCAETGTPPLPGPSLSNNPPLSNNAPPPSQEQPSNPTPPTDNGNGNNNENNGGNPSQPSTGGNDNGKGSDNSGSDNGKTNPGTNSPPNP